jgi:hypothetical protein
MYLVMGFNSESVGAFSNAVKKQAESYTPPNAAPEAPAVHPRTASGQSI